MSVETTTKKGSISAGLLMIPKTAGLPSFNTHKRAGSTGTTGDESYTTDEEDNLETEEPEVTIRDQMTRNLFDLPSAKWLPGHRSNEHSSLAEKLSHLSVGHRNSSDSSVYNSDLEKDLNSDDSKSTNNSDEVDWSGSVIKDDEAFVRLQNDLKKANDELKIRNQELDRMGRIKQDVETELEDLTASLFQEAHNMVREANEKQAAAEKALKESEMKVDVLTAEVAALKTLVLTSTPSSPNPHLHPQISKDDQGVAIFAKRHRRSPSHFNLKYGRENSPPDSPVKETIFHITNSEIESKEGLEVDPNVHKEFLSWRQNPLLNKANEFIQRIYTEDIHLCLNFDNTELSQKVTEAVEAGTILIEAISDKTKAMFPRKCALLQVPRLCFYRMNIGDIDNWYSISQLCRNRIIAVCDLLNYLKYIERGLVKSSAHDVYWEIVRLRKNMSLARLGLNLNNS